MCCQSFNGGYKKNQQNLPSLVRKPTSGRSACLCREGEWGGTSLLSSWCLGISAFISVEGGQGLCLGGCYEGTCCEPASSHRIFRWLLQGRDGKIRWGTSHPLPNDLWWTLIHCIWEPGPIHANDFDLIAFISTLLSCERSKVQNIRELWPW